MPTMRPVFRFNINGKRFLGSGLLLTVATVCEAGNELQASTFPSLQRRGGCGINKKSRSHRSAADGGRSPRKPDRAQPSTEAVAHTQMFQNAFRNVTCERPPRPRRFGTGPFF